jgi:hypothetical protein
VFIIDDDDDNKINFKLYKKKNKINKLYFISKIKNSFQIRSKNIKYDDDDEYNNKYIFFNFSFEIYKNWQLYKV